MKPEAWIRDILSVNIPIVIDPYRIVTIAFFLKGQFTGRYGSLGPSKSTSASAPVLTSIRGCLMLASRPESPSRSLAMSECKRWPACGFLLASGFICDTSLGGIVIGSCVCSSLPCLKPRQECTLSSSDTSLTATLTKDFEIISGLRIEDQVNKTRKSSTRVRFRPDDQKHTVEPLARSSC